jgi:hypothetical protein
MVPKARWRPGRPHWDEELICWVLRLTYDYRTRTGAIYFPPGNCCDMRACVGRFVALDADVQLIRTFAGDEADTVYHKEAEGAPDGDGWTAYVPKRRCR